MTTAYSLSLYVKHPFRDPEAIAETFGLKAIHSHRAGEPRRTPTGVPLEGTYAESYACFDFEPAAPLDEQILRVSRFLRRHEPLLCMLQSEGGRLSYQIGFSRSSLPVILPPGAFAAAAALGIEVGVSIYAVA